MSDDSKKPDVDGEKKVDNPDTNGDNKSKDGGEKQPTVEELQAQIAKKDEEIGNLKGTQSAQSKSMDEMKSSLDSFKGSFEKAGVDPKDLNSLIKKQERSGLLMSVAAEKGVNASNMEFIKGDTKEEMEASIEKFQSAIKEQVDATVGAAKADGDKKKEIPKNDNKRNDPKPEDEKAQAGQFLRNQKMIPEEKK